MYRVARSRPPTVLANPQSIRTPAYPSSASATSCGLPLPVSYWAMLGDALLPRPGQVGDNENGAVPSYIPPGSLCTDPFPLSTTCGEACARLIRSAKADWIPHTPVLESDGVVCAAPWRRGRPRLPRFLKLTIPLEGSRARFHRPFSVCPRPHEQRSSKEHDRPSCMPCRPALHFCLPARPRSCSAWAYDPVGLAFRSCSPDAQSFPPLGHLSDVLHSSAYLVPRRWASRLRQRSSSSLLCSR